AIWVLYWFDRNDTPERRGILQVHPRGNPDNPLRGVFATRAPVRPNLIALSRCRILSIAANRIEIDGIDAFPDTPVLDIKP
ncbi:MAG: SAM-dependent methyltransferase, partial [Candidatus Thiodiazotropha sp. (ex Codakia orbicularis)]|nr:SAM-dependent methyltransferase [Candidatus Thiodiazotropha sp. (ex Codakia orbicularis)]